MSVLWAVVAGISWRRRNCIGDDDDDDAICMALMESHFELEVALALRRLQVSAFFMGPARRLLVRCKYPDGHSTS
jgi:hypothetical protein